MRGQTNSASEPDPDQSSDAKPILLHLSQPLWPGHGLQKTVYQQLFSSPVLWFKIPASGSPCPRISADAQGGANKASRTSCQATLDDVRPLHASYTRSATKFPCLKIPKTWSVPKCSENTSCQVDAPSRTVADERHDNRNACGAARHMLAGGHVEPPRLSPGGSIT